MHDRGQNRGPTYCNKRIPSNVQEKLRKLRVTEMTNDED